jgi:potassium/hydrogen antiporter
VPAVNVESFAFAVLVAALVGVAAVLSNRLGEWMPISVPALFLVGAALASDVWPLDVVPISAVEQVATVALAEFTDTTPIQGPST